MDVTVSPGIVEACLGGAGGAASAWLARKRCAPAAIPGDAPSRRPTLWSSRLAQLALAAVVAAGTAVSTASMLGSRGGTPWVGVDSVPAALSFFWIGFVTVGWIAAERDKLLLHQAVCRAATAPAAHPDTVQALAHASPEAIYEAVKALVPRRVVH